MVILCVGIEGKEFEWGVFGWGICVLEGGWDMIVCGGRGEVRGEGWGLFEDLGWVEWIFG